MAKSKSKAVRPKWDRLCEGIHLVSSPDHPGLFCCSPLPPAVRVYNSVANLHRPLVLAIWGKGRPPRFDNFFHFHKERFRAWHRLPELARKLEADGNSSTANRFWSEFSKKESCGVQRRKRQSPDWMCSTGMSPFDVEISSGWPSKLLAQPDAPARLKDFDSRIPPDRDLPLLAIDF